MGREAADRRPRSSSSSARSSLWCSRSACRATAAGRRGSRPPARRAPAAGRATTRRCSPSRQTSRFTLRLDMRRPIAHGQPVDVFFDAERLYLFDAVTGEALEEPAPEPAEPVQFPCRAARCGAAPADRGRARPRHGRLRVRRPPSRPRLVVEGHDVITLQRGAAPQAGVECDRSTSSASRLTICRPASMPSIHLAARLDDPFGIDRTLAEIAGPNVMGTLRLLEAASARGVRRFVHGSTGGVGLNRLPAASCTRTTRRAPSTRTGSRSTSPSRLYGPRVAVRAREPRYFAPYARDGSNPMFAHHISAIERGEPIEVGAAGTPELNPVHVDDAVAATSGARRTGPPRGGRHRRPRRRLDAQARRAAQRGRRPEARRSRAIRGVVEVGGRHRADAPPPRPAIDRAPAEILRESGTEADAEPIRR